MANEIDRASSNGFWKGKTEATLEGIARSIDDLKDEVKHQRETVCIPRGQAVANLVSALKWNTTATIGAWLAIGTVGLWVLKVALGI